MKTFQILLIGACLVVGSVLAAQIQEQQPKKPVTRAKRPSFDQKDWGGIFFEDIFADGLVGQRPSKSEVGVAKEAPKTADNSATSASASGWSSLIDGSVLENEVKRWQQDLEEKVTTPVKFKTTHQEISDQFSMLAMWFTIISQYESDVRWNESADSVRAAFMDASVKSRGTDMSAFQNAQRRTEDLTRLVRGEKFPDEPGATEEVDDWSMIVDRNPIMTRLELSVSEELKQATASEKDFKNAIDVVMHEAGIIAATSRVLQLPEMLDADDEDYAAYSQEMLDAALEMKAAAVAKNLDDVNSALNRINQACTNCHGDFR